MKKKTDEWKHTQNNNNIAAKYTLRSFSQRVRLDWTIPFIEMCVD